MPRKRHAKPSGTDRKIAKIMRKLNISDGDVLLVKRESMLGSKEMIDLMGQKFEELYNHRVLFIVVDELEDIRKCDEQTMLKYGWLRWPRKQENQEQKE